MVNAEKHKAETKAADDGVKPIKSTIAADFGEEKAFALCSVYSHEVKEYVANKFKKEITDVDVLNFAMMLCCYVVTAETTDEKAEILKDITEIIADDNKLNEFIFTRLATIRAWNETTATLHSKEKVTESEFNELMNANVEKYQYKAWNDERAILDKYSSKVTDGGA